jgi:hypothetical protein
MSSSAETQGTKTQDTKTEPQAKETSPWAPLASTRFRVLWLAQFVSGIGTWMQTVGAQWLLLDNGPALVAPVQTAASLPVFLLALPAGVLAVLAIVADVPPWLLLTLTFLIGCGTSIVGPTWQSIQPDIVPPDQLRQAAALSSVDTNIGRAVGPSLGGLVVAVAGAGWAFAANALSFLVIAFAVARYAPASRKHSDAERGHILAAVRAGGRYLRYAPGVRRILLRALLFVPAGSVLWALLPTVAHDRMHLGSGGYGLLLGLPGAGAVGGAFALPRLSHRVDANGVLAICGVVCAAATATLPFCSNAVLAVVPLLLAGAAWIGALSTLNAATQLRLPSWVRARGLGLLPGGVHGRAGRRLRRVGCVGIGDEPERGHGDRDRTAVPGRVECIGPAPARRRRTGPLGRTFLGRAGAHVRAPADRRAGAGDRGVPGPGRPARRVHPRHCGGRAVPPAYRRQPLGTVPGHCRSRPVHLATGEPVVRHAIQPEPA